jgi:ribosomal protein S18 acetylase RimI-like enzyme
MQIPARNAVLCCGRTVTLRSPGPDDADTTLAFARELFRDAWRHLAHPPAFFENMTVAAQARFLTGLAEHSHDFMLCAFVDGVVAGTTNLTVETASFSKHVGALGLGVRPAFRHLGLGTLLATTLATVAAERGITNLLLRVRTGNAAAIRLYERLGFQRAGTLRAIARLDDGTVADEHVYQRLAGDVAP